MQIKWVQFHSSTYHSILSLQRPSKHAILWVASTEFDCKPSPAIGPSSVVQQWSYGDHERIVLHLYKRQTTKESYLKGLHECLGATPSDGSKIVDQVSFGHSDTSIDEADGLLLRVGDDFDVEIFTTGLYPGWISKALISDLIKGLVENKKSFKHKSLNLACVKTNKVKLQVQ